MRLLSIFLLITFCFFAVFGLYIPMMSHGGHDEGCLMSLGAAALCAVPLAHLQNWQAAFTAIFMELLTLWAAMLLIRARFDLFDSDVASYRYGLILRRTPARPTLFQELYSDGILNRKEPHFS